MNILKVTTDLRMSVHEYPTDASISVQNKFIRKLIGNKCECFEHVMPERLYTNFNVLQGPTKTPGQCVSMLVDEEGVLKKGPIANALGCYLYGTDIHGTPIVGDIIFVGEKLTPDGIEFCGIDDDVFSHLSDAFHQVLTMMAELGEGL